jgi:hypothetical protein
LEENMAVFTVLNSLGHGFSTEANGTSTQPGATPATTMGVYLPLGVTQTRLELAFWRWPAEADALLA